MAWFRTDPQEVLKETVLWTNPDATSNFTAQTVDLSDDINNYDYIAVEYNYSTSGADKSKSIMSVTDFKKGGYNTSVVRNCMTSGIINSSNSCWARAIQYVSDTSIRFTDCYQFTSSTVATSNCIPTQIIGIKRGIEVNPIFDLSLPPDAIYINASMANNATATLAVTQKPRLIVVFLISTTTYTGETGFYNVETGNAYRYAYFGNDPWHNEIWNTATDFITSVTSSSVSIKNAWGGTVHIAVGAYY